MDTGNIMENKMDDLIEHGLQIQEEVASQAEQIYRETKLYPNEILEHRNELLEALIKAALYFKANNLGDATNTILNSANKAIEKALK